MFRNNAGMYTDRVQYTRSLYILILRRDAGNLLTIYYTINIRNFKHITKKYHSTGRSIDLGNPPTPTSKLFSCVKYISRWKQYEYIMLHQQTECNMSI